MFDLTFLVYEGLYQITCLFLFHLLLVWFAVLLLSGYKVYVRMLTGILKDLGLQITTHMNQKIVNFLDVTLNLNDGKHKPYRQLNNDPLYIHRHFNHPPSIIKQLPASINHRISKLSCDQETFDSAAPLYENALKQSNFNVQLTYTSTNAPHDQDTYPDRSNTANQTSNRRSRNRHVIWYNPPYTKNVKSNIGRQFLSLIDKHFPATNRLHKLFNRNTVKISYSCMENLKDVIRGHNNCILQNRHRTSTNKYNTNTDTDRPNSDTNTNDEVNNASSNTNTNTLENGINSNSDNSCNCRHKNKCPTSGNCLAKSVIYKAEVNSPPHNESTNR